MITEGKVRISLFDHADKQGLRRNQQFEFRQIESTEIVATLFTDDILNQVDDKSLDGCVFIDAPFHVKLLAKLSSCAVSGG